jgi:predicted RNase H-like nuclease (RuvC/YqgF family)
MTDNEIVTLKTDIALIQKDVKQIELVFRKVDNAVTQMADIVKTIAVQDNILENTEKRISNVEENFKKHNEEEEAFRKELSLKLEDMKDTSQKERQARHLELLASIDNLNKNLTEKLNQQDKRIQSLENWRWYILGIGAVIVFILNKIPWAVLFG